MSAGPEDIAVWVAEKWELEQRVRQGIEVRREAGTLAPHPAPTVACRLAEPQEMGGAALRLQRAVQAAGGTVQATYCQGYGMHSRTGRPTALRDSVAIRCWGPGGRRMVVIWTRPAGGKTWVCDFRMTWSSDRQLQRLTDEGMRNELAEWSRTEVA